MSRSLSSSSLDRYLTVRQFTKTICEPLETEDYVIQSMPDVSPTRWHLAHTTWFFETFLLKPFCKGYSSNNDAFEYLFNSYYNAVGKQYPRDRRGLLSRPTMKEVWAYRDSVDQAMGDLISSADRNLQAELNNVLELGLQHEQQHQELMLTDIKHVLSCNPLNPAYHSAAKNDTNAPNVQWITFQGGIQRFGFAGEGFRFDNEGPSFEQLLQDYQLQDRLVTNGEYLDFVNDQGYERPEHWLSMGWSAVGQEGWNAPLHWRNKDGKWFEFTLAGMVPLDLDQPVCHVSYFEADAFARWSGCRLATELEWEHAATHTPFSGNIAGNFAENKNFHPATCEPLDGGVQQAYGDVWEWTSSPYTAYPGYRPPDGALGEYNGKFMCNQFVLRGGSCATSKTHIRPTYRNFFPPNARWQFTGIRLAR